MAFHDGLDLKSNYENANYYYYFFLRLSSSQCTAFVNGFWKFYENDNVPDISCLLILTKKFLA